MSYELHENEWARDMILRRDLGKNTFETVTRVARYYLESGFSKAEVRKLLDAFVIQCDPEASLALYSDLLDNAVKRALKRHSVNIDEICITKKEMDTIGKLEQRQAKRLAFTLLCFAKYLDQIYPNNDHWVNVKDSDLMRAANISTSIKRQSSIYNYLYNNYLIEFSKMVDNINTQVSFIDDNSPVVLRVTDLRNLGYQYLKYIGEPNYFVCEGCGITEKYTSPKGFNRRFCPDCANKIKMKKKVNSIMCRNLRDK